MNIMITVLLPICWNERGIMDCGIAGLLE